MESDTAAANGNVHRANIKVSLLGLL